MTFERQRVTLTFTDEEKNKIQDVIDILKDVSIQMDDHCEESLTGINRFDIYITDEDIDNTVNALGDLLIPADGFVVE